MRLEITINPEQNFIGKMENTIKGFLLILTPIVLPHLLVVVMSN